MATTVTDCFGDFKFDGLKEEKVVYNISIRFLGREKRLEVKLNNSVYLGDIKLG